MVDGCHSKLVNVVSGVLQGSVLGQLLFLLDASELFSILEYKLVGYLHDSTLMTVVPSPIVRVAVAESMIRDLGRVSEWSDLWGMKLNASETKTMIVSRSRTMHPQWPPLTIVFNCTEGVWWRWYILSDIWFQDDLWEASLLGFQSSKTWYLEIVLASVPWSIAS